MGTAFDITEAVKIRVPIEAKFIACPECGLQPSVIKGELYAAAHPLTCSLSGTLPIAIPWGQPPK